ncbi:hypothetical protein [Effusibacillus consociatus]|uniref:Uncharacterized protein n=1 Tax=Effusibacillus consociatus TaxID=1117041 RepID=A0ABV9PZR5_9BACL
MINKNKRLKKVVAALTITGSVLVTNFASAADVWSSSQGWTTKEGSYAPYWGNTAFHEVSENGKHYLEPWARFKYDQATIDNIKFYYESPTYNWYPGFDISVTDDYNTSVNADVTQLYSTFPNPYYDVDDDPETKIPAGNGYNDESEVVCLAPLQMTAETDYRFKSNFKIVTKAATEYAFTANENNQYMNTTRYDTRLKRTYTPQL